MKLIEIRMHTENSEIKYTFGFSESFFNLIKCLKKGKTEKDLCADILKAFKESLNEAAEIYKNKNKGGGNG